MFIIELFFWMLRFVWVSFWQIIMLPFALFSSDISGEHKFEMAKQALFSVPILSGGYLMLLTPHFLWGFVLMLCTMVFGAMIVKDDGRIG